MSDDLQSPNLVEKGKNLAKFSWQLIITYKITTRKHS